MEAGVRAGRELILTKPIITIGRAEACDIGLFGDPSIERLHARILQQGERYLIADAGSAVGTYLNDERVGTDAVAARMHGWKSTSLERRSGMGENCIRQTSW